MEVECPCKSFSPSPPYDLEGAAREFYDRETERDGTLGTVELMTKFAFLCAHHESRERIADAVPKWVRVEDRLPPCARTYGDLKDKPYVLVVDTKGRTAVAYPVEYSNPKDGVRWVSGKAIGQVVAWMPIPPYVQREARKDD
jgi:hypothetical protein